MVDVRFELTTNDPRSVDDAICSGICPLGYWEKVNQSSAQTKSYNNLVNYYPCTEMYTRLGVIQVAGLRYVLFLLHVEFLGVMYSS